MLAILRSLLKLQLLATLLGIALFALASPLVRRAFVASHETTARAATGLLSPAPSPAPTGIRQIALTTKDLVYDPVGQRIYASLPSAAPNGNSLAQIDPFAGTVGNPVFIGSEPGKLAISDNSQYIYTSLDAAAAVRRFDIATQTAGLQFTLGSDSFGNYYVNDIAVMPGHPETVAIARKYNGPIVGEANVAIYDDAAVRLNTTANGLASVIQFGASPTTLYCYENSTSDFGFRTMTVNSSGVSVSSTLNNYISGFGVGIRAAGGLIYATSGRVLNPATSMLAGTFPGITPGSLVVPDPPANRVYFLTGSGSSTLTLKAFDLTTFLPTGSMSIPGVSGTPGSFIKWGDDGLAFRSSGNQIFLLSTADIVPVSASATPTPLSVASGITRLPLITNDIVFDQNTQKVYASLPSSAGTFGNSLSPIDPQSGLMGAPVFVGSEPKRLAISDNGQFIYVALDGAALIRKFDVGSQSVGIQFGLGSSTSFGPMLPQDMAVVPGSPSSLAVARGNFGNILATVFDDGVVRGSNAAFVGSAIEFSSSPGTIYSYATSGLGGTFYKLAVSPSGVSIVSAVGNFITGNVDIRYDGGRLYATDGSVYDPEALTLLGTLSGGSGLVVPDSAAGRVYCLAGLGSSTLTLKSYDTNTFAQNGTLTISGVSGTPGSFIKAGVNTLAFRTESQVYFVQISAMTPMTSIPTPTQVATGIVQLPVAANDLVYDPNTQKIYASLPGNVGGFGNSLAPIDPITGTMSSPIFIGSEPRKLAISNDNQFIYAGLDGVGSVRRFGVASQTAGLQFPLGSGQFSGRRYVDDLAVLPDKPNAVAIARRNKTSSPRHEGVVVYDDDVPRPNATSGASLNEVIEFSATPSKLYGYNNESTEFGLHKLIVNSAGVSVASTLSTNIAGFGVDMKYSNGNLYSSTGQAVNAETGAGLGAFPGVNTFAFVPDATVRRVYYITGTGVATTIQAFDQDAFASVGSLTIPGVNGTATNMIRWGANGLAFTTSGGQIFFVQSSSLVPVASKSGSATVVTSSLNPSNAGQPVTFTANVTSSAGTPTGSVQFQDGGVNLGSPQPLINGTASISTSTLNGGLRTITADYSGDSNFLVSGGTAAQSVLPLISINDVSATEGQAGTKSFNFTITLSAASNQTVTVHYATADGTATAGSDYTAANGTVTFNPGDPLTKTVAVLVNGDQIFEPDESFFVNLSSPVNAAISKSQAIGTILNDDAQGGFISFSSGTYGVSESIGLISIGIARSNDTSRAATVDYTTTDAGAPTSCATTNGLASSRCDFTTAVGTLRFAPGETFKTILVLVNRDSYAEGSETFGISLTNPTGGAVIVGSTTAVGTIFDSPNPSGTPANIVDDAAFFVRQHYADFLNRQPDQAGLDFWVGNFTQCNGDPQCIEARRVNVSAAFFLSIEFQQTGYLVERLYKAAYGDGSGISTFPSAHMLPVPIVLFNEFLADTQEIGRSVVVGQTGWEQQLENNKQAFTAAFVQRPRFTTALPSNLTAAQFVDTLNTNAGNPLSQAERDQLVSDLTTNAKTRAQVLRAVAEDPDLNSAEFNRAFVLMQFFGYLRRNPNDAPDTDYTGYDFWLTKLNQFSGNFQNAEMVKAFISSLEYRQRFGP